MARPTASIAIPEELLVDLADLAISEKWRWCSALTVVQAALLTVDVDPEDKDVWFLDRVERGG